MMIGGHVQDSFRDTTKLGVLIEFVGEKCAFIGAGLSVVRCGA